MSKQYFLVIAPSLRSTLISGVSVGLGQMLFQDEMDCSSLGDPDPQLFFRVHFGDIARLVTNLIVPIRPTHPTPSEGNEASLAPLDRSQMASRNSRHGLHLLNLPRELQDLVFESLDLHDCIHLGRAHFSFWSILQNTIVTHHMAILGQWAGQSIICVGEEGRPGDYPAATLFSQEEEIEVSQYVYTSETGYVTPRNLYLFARDNYTEIEKLIMQGMEFCGDPPFFASRLESCEHCNLDKEFPWEDYDSISYQYKKVADPQLGRFCPVEKSWILRNLTTKQFVRSEGIALRPDFIGGPHIKILGFGHVVLSRICWSSDSNTGLDYKGNIHRGIWAGHSFDITTVDRHEEAIKNDQGWEDISEEVAEELAEIWGSKYGFDWSRKVINNLLPYSW